VLHAFARNEGDAWEFTLDQVTEFFERAATKAAPPPLSDQSTAGLTHLAEHPDRAAQQTIGTYIDHARLIGRRTAELHNVLAAESNDSAFAPEPYTGFYQRSLYQSMRNLSGRVLQSLERRVSSLEGEAQHDARVVTELEPAILERFRSLVQEPIPATRIRCHGDYHLGQLLYTGKDFVVTDFEGEPLHPLSERRMKRTPLRDVAGMLRSFHYAAHAPIVVGTEAQNIRTEDRDRLRAWAQFWYSHVSAAFLGEYFAVIQPGLLPGEPEHRRILLDSYLLEKAIYEISYELNNRPEWLTVPLRGVLSLLEGS
jgi:maltose alpha-D-glucosyltransferase / alpha-amylase